MIVREQDFLPVRYTRFEAPVKSRRAHCYASTVVDSALPPPKGHPSGLSRDPHGRRGLP